MPSYIETTVNSVPTNLKPILFTNYKVITKYDIEITYEDSTTKTVELVQGDKGRPYKFVIKKDGQLLEVTGVPKIKEISEHRCFCDFANRTLDSNDLLIELDCSSQYECNKVRFYLKDIRDIVDIINEVEEQPEEPDTPDGPTGDIQSPIVGEDEEEFALNRAVTTADTLYLGDGVKPALGIGLTPSYKQYKNSKKYVESAFE